MQARHERGRAAVYVRRECPQAAVWAAVPPLWVTVPAQALLELDELIVKPKRAAREMRYGELELAPDDSVLYAFGSSPCYVLSGCVGSEELKTPVRFAFADGSPLRDVMSVADKVERRHADAPSLTLTVCDEMELTVRVRHGPTGTPCFVRLLSVVI